MKAKFDYDSEALKLATAIDIACGALQKYPPQDWTTYHVAHFVKVYSEWKNLALNQAPQFKKPASLNQIIQNVFTYFQEGAGEAVEYFWLQIRREDLLYVRENKLNKILKRGKLKSRGEYEFVTDLLIAAEQEGRISEQETHQLSSMIGEFEKRKK